MLAAIISCVMSAGALAACGGSAPPSATPTASTSVGQSTTTPPAVDFDDLEEPAPGELSDSAPPARNEASSAQCGSEPVAFGYSLIEAATGARYFIIEVRNCGNTDLTPPAPPQLAGYDLSGTPIELTGSGDTTVTIGPDQSAYLHLQWRTNGRCERGVTRLEVTVAGTTDTVEDCFQLGNPDGFDYGDPGLRWRWSLSDDTQ